MSIRIYVVGTDHESGIVKNANKDLVTEEYFFEYKQELASHLLAVLSTVRQVSKRRDVRIARITTVNESFMTTVYVPRGYLVRKQSTTVYVHHAADPALGGHASFHFSLECKSARGFMRTINQLTDPELLRQLVCQAHPEPVKSEPEPVGEVDDLVFDE